MSWRELPTDPFKYTMASSAELGYGDTVTRSERFEYFPEGGQRIGVIATQPAKYGEVRSSEKVPERTVIVPAAGEYRIEPFWALQMQQLATQFDARVIGVEMPGTVGLTYPDTEGRMLEYQTTDRLQGATQTPLQLMGALGGDFSRHVDVQLEAIRHTVGLPEHGKYLLYGTSMGATIATEMVAAMSERGLDVSEVILHEMVNAFPGSRPELLIKVARIIAGKERDRRTKYIAENAAIGHTHTAFELSGDTDEEIYRHKQLDDARKRVSQQAVAGWANMAGMIHGREEKLLTTLDHYEGPRPLITLVKGRESAAATEADYAHMHARLHLGGHAVRTFTVVDVSNTEKPVAMGHAHHFSIGRLRDIFEALADNT